MLRCILALLLCLSPALSGCHVFVADGGKAKEDCRIVPNCKCGCTNGEACLCLSKKSEDPTRASAVHYNCPGCETPPRACSGCGR